MIRTLRGEFALAHLPSPPIAGVLGGLGAPTFTYPDLPPCWGRAFENYRTFAEYLTPHADDADIAARCAPLEAHARLILEAQGYTLTSLGWPTSNLRRLDIPAGSSILHVDDLVLDGAWKPDFVLPEPLRGGFVQTSFFLWMAVEGDARLRCHDRRPSPALERLPNGWQFAPSAVAGAATIDVVPTPGTFVLMPNHFLHDVCGGERPAVWWAWSMYVLAVPGSRTLYAYI